jgi:hypothetical protein
MIFYCNKNREPRPILFTIACPEKSPYKPKPANECSQPNTNTNFEKKLIYA